MKWLRDYYEALSPYSEPGGYINFMQDDDAGNLFHMNQNIAP